MLISILSDGLLPLVHKEFLQMYPHSPSDSPMPLALIHSVVRCVPCVPCVCGVCRVCSCFCCWVTESYWKGTVGVVTGSSMYSFAEDEQAGYPLPCNEIKLVDIPQQGFSSRGNVATPRNAHTHATHPSFTPCRCVCVCVCVCGCACAHTGTPERGRIKIRGHNVFVGYYGDSKLTDAKIDAEGWLTTNDIGQWNPNGTLTVLGHEQGILQPVKGQIVLYAPPPQPPAPTSAPPLTNTTCIRNAANVADVIIKNGVVCVVCGTARSTWSTCTWRATSCSRSS